MKNYFKQLAKIILEDVMSYSTLRSGDYGLFCRRVDGSPTLAYTHGFCSNHTYFGHQIRHFEGKGFGTLAWDLAGFGQSSKPLVLSAYTKDRHVENLEMIISNGCGGKVVLVGHSMGAMISQEYAAKHPENVEALVLIASTCNVRKAMSEDPVLNLANLFSDIMRSTIRAWNVFNPVRTSYSPDFTDTRYRTVGDIEYLTAMLAGMSREDIEASCLVSEEMLGWDTSEAAKRITAPTLIIHGSKDQLLPVGAAYELHGLIPSSQPPVIIKGADHALCFRKPDEVTALIEGFIKNLNL